MCVLVGKKDTYSLTDSWDAGTPTPTTTTWMGSPEDRQTRGAHTPTPARTLEHIRRPRRGTLVCVLAGTMYTYSYTNADHLEVCTNNIRQPRRGRWNTNADHVEVCTNTGSFSGPLQIHGPRRGRWAHTPTPLRDTNADHVAVCANTHFWRRLRKYKMFTRCLSGRWAPILKICVSWAWCESRVKGLCLKRGVGHFRGPYRFMDPDEVHQHIRRPRQDAGTYTPTPTRGPTNTPTPARTREKTPTAPRDTGVCPGWKEGHILPYRFMGRWNINADHDHVEGLPREQADAFISRGGGVLSGTGTRTERTSGTEDQVQQNRRN